VRSESEIREVIGKFDDADDDGDGLEGESEAVRDALLWVIDTYIPNDRVLAYLPE
jgi:hypothetical protein